MVYMCMYYLCPSFRIQAAEAGFDWCVATSREMYTLKKDDGLGDVLVCLFFCGNMVSWYHYADIHTILRF